MKKPAIVLVVLLALGACSSGEDEEAFCDALIALNTFDRKSATVDDMRGLVDDLVAAAPEAISDEAATFGEGMQALTEGDFESAADPAFESAATEINTYATENCEGLAEN